jgi:hypothetical protein
MKLVVFLAALLLSATVYAADATITWQMPTQNVDSSSIPSSGPGSLTRTIIQWGSCGTNNTFGNLIGAQSVLVPATSTIIVNLNPGQTYCFRGLVENTFGEQSAASNVVARLIPAPVPRPPVLSSTVSVVWSYKRMGWGETLEVVGTAPLGTACGALVVAEAGMYEIPRDAVTLHTPLRGGTPVTFCDLT